MQRNAAEHLPKTAPRSQAILARLPCESRALVAQDAEDAEDSKDSHKHANPSAPYRPSDCRPAAAALPRTPAIAVAIAAEHHSHAVHPVQEAKSQRRPRNDFMHGWGRRSAEKSTRVIRVPDPRAWRRGKWRRRAVISARRRATLNSAGGAGRRGRRTQRAVCSAAQRSAVARAVRAACAVCERAGSAAVGRWVYECRPRHGGSWAAYGAAHVSRAVENGVWRAPGDVKYPAPVARGRRSGAPVCASLRWLVKQRVACFLRMGAVANGAGCGLTSDMRSAGCAETLTVQAVPREQLPGRGCGWDADVSEPLMQVCFAAKCPIGYRTCCCCYGLWVMGKPETA
jgi:hypothetical protein